MVAASALGAPNHSPADVLVNRLPDATIHSPAPVPAPFTVRISWESPPETSKMPLTEYAREPIVTFPETVACADHVSPARVDSSAAIGSAEGAAVGAGELGSGEADGPPPAVPPESDGAALGAADGEAGEADRRTSGPGLLPHPTRIALTKRSRARAVHGPALEWRIVVPSDGRVRAAADGTAHRRRSTLVRGRLAFVAVRRSRAPIITSAVSHPRGSTPRGRSRGSPSDRARTGSLLAPNRAGRVKAAPSARAA